MLNICTTIKNNGVAIYTILFNHGTGQVMQSTQTLFQSCASSPNNYYLAPAQADSQVAFQQIGTQLASLSSISIGHGCGPATGFCQL
jgi:hypothetical protein